MNGVVSSEPLIHQGYLEKVVRSLFGNKEEIIVNARKEASIKNPSTGYYLEVDIWIPKLNICFEFQDAYHYVLTWDSQKPLEDVKYKDKMKKEEIQKRGDTVIIVPCWWDCTEQSLVSTIQFYRPDLLRNKKNSSACATISLNQPTRFFRDGNIPDVGELMLASFPLSAQFYSAISTNNYWWMGEKYDGVRSCWNPELGEIYNRSGVEINLHPAVENNFPDIFLDGELWLGRGGFAESQQLVNNLTTTNWSFFRLISFDEPDPLLHCSPFEERYQRLMQNVDTESPIVLLAPRVLCSNSLHLRNISEEIIRDGGEGVILRQPSSLYKPGRSLSLIKVKAFREDQEALVVEVIDSDTFELLRPDGSSFTAYNQDIVHPSRGDVVSFSYDSFSHNIVPVDPKIFRIRTDLNWEDVLLNFKKDSEFTKLAAGQQKPIGHWILHEGRNMRAYFKDFAKSRGFDPLVAENWYLVSRLEFLAEKGAKTVLYSFGGSLVKALHYAFPDIVLEELQFDKLRQCYWNDADNRRSFFEKYAKEHGFNPLVPENWYTISAYDCMTQKRASSILKYYNNSIASALIHLFPEIGLQPRKFNFNFKKRKKIKK